MPGDGTWRRELEDVVAAECERLALPGAIVGVRREGDEHFVPCGVTNAEHPLAIDEHTVFPVASDGGGDIGDIGRDASGTVTWVRSGLRIRGRLDGGPAA